MNTRSILLATLLFSLTSCGALGGDGLQSILGQLGGFASNVTNWRQALPAVIGEQQLAQLGDYSKQAGGLLDTLKGSLQGAETATQQGFTGVLESLGKMSGIDVSALKGLGNPERKAAVDMFSNAAGSLGTAVKNLMGSGLPGLGS